MKDVAELTYADFVLHPVWSWAETDDESLVEPVPCQGGVLPDEHTRDSLFVAATLRLADGTTTPGTVSVRLSDRSVYAVGVAVANDELVEVSLQAQLRGDALRELAHHFGPRAASVFPLRFSTDFAFAGGRRLAGTLAL